MSREAVIDLQMCVGGEREEEEEEEKKKQQENQEVFRHTLFMPASNSLEPVRSCHPLIQNSNSDRLENMIT